MLWVFWGRLSLLAINYVSVPRVFFLKDAGERIFMGHLVRGHDMGIVIFLLEWLVKHVSSIRANTLGRLRSELPCLKQLALSG